MIIEEAKEFFGDYKGELYDKLRQNPDAYSLFLEIEPCLLTQDWSDVKDLLTRIAKCLKVPSVLHPAMATDYIERILTYPLQEMKVKDSNLKDKLRARWSFSELMQASLISPGHWLVERELIAIVLGHDYDLVLRPPRFPYIEPHSTSIMERTQYCPDYPQFALLSQKGRRGMMFAIHCNFKGDVVSGVSLREYLHEEYEDAINECIQAGFLSRNLEAKDYLHHLTNQTLKAILQQYGGKPANSKTELVDVVSQIVPTQELGQFVGHLIRPSDVRILCQVRQLRRLLGDEKERMSSWSVKLKQSWGMLPSSDGFQRDLAKIRENHIHTSPMLNRPVVNIAEPTLRKVASLSVWRDYWDVECDRIVGELGNELGWNAFLESAKKIKEYWGAVKSARFESETHEFTPHKMGLLGGTAVWNSTLELYCEARRIEIGAIGPTPQNRICHNCDREFNEASIPPKLASLAGNYLGFCRECLEIAFYRRDAGKVDKDPLGLLVELCISLGQIPPSSFIRVPELPRGFDSEKYRRIIHALIELPILDDYVGLFGSWFKALNAAHVLGDDPLRTQRGYRAIAYDGHECHSLPELTIDNWLTSHKLAHTREPYYPFHPQLNSNERLRADWEVGVIYIEYFGMMEDADYHSRAEKKVRLAQATNINLLTLLPKDVIRLDESLAVLI